MVITLSVDSNNDLFLGADGNISVSRGIEAILQSCEQAAKTRLGEVVLNINEGIPFFETVWNGSPNLLQFESAVREALLGVTGVTGVPSFQTRIIDGILTYQAVINTIFGAGEING